MSEGNFAEEEKEINYREIYRENYEIIPQSNERIFICARRDASMCNGFAVRETQNHNEAKNRNARRI